MRQEYYLSAVMIRKAIRWVLIVFISLVAGILMFLLLAIKPLDRTSYKTQEFYSAMMDRLDSLVQKPVTLPKAEFHIGYAKENITPAHPTATAGYGKRKGKLTEGILDSVFVRAMVIRTSSSKIAVVSADLLIIPPTVTEVLHKRLPEIGFTLDNTYLGATHTHNSIGNWMPGATQFLYGEYSDTVVTFLADKIIASIRRAAETTLPATLKSGQIPIGNVVKNRIVADGPVDSLLRIVEVHRSDSSKLILLSHTAHATCLSSKYLKLSRDYPGKLVDTFEEQGYAFAMFMAGAVGSHGRKAPQSGEPCIDHMAHEISTQFMVNRGLLHRVQDSTLVMTRVPLNLPETQAKISANWGVRPWLFRSAVGEYPVYLTVLRLGDVVMLGTPCDYSGEFNAQLDAVGEQYKLQIMVTGFNGGYMGYVTPVAYFDRDHYETRLMNWYGLGTGEYMTECLEKLIVSVSDR